MKGEELKTKRNELRITQQQLASALGVARNTVARWERGEMAIPSFLHLALMSVENIPLDCFKTQVSFGGMAKEVIAEIQEELSVNIYEYQSLDSSENYGKRDFFYDASRQPKVELWKADAEISSWVDLRKPTEISILDDYGKPKSRRILKEKLTETLNKYLESDQQNYTTKSS